MLRSFEREGLSTHTALAVEHSTTQIELGFEPSRTRRSCGWRGTPGTTSYATWILGSAWKVTRELVFVELQGCPSNWQRGPLMILLVCTRISVLCSFGRYGHMHSNSATLCCLSFFCASDPPTPKMVVPTRLKQSSSEFELCACFTAPLRQRGVKSEQCAKPIESAHVS